MAEESIRAFMARHGGDPVEVNGFLLFPTGARCEGGTTGGGRREEPPADPIERQRFIVKYFEIVATRASNEFANHKQLLYTHAQGVAAGRPQFALPDERDLEQLRALQAKAKESKRQLDDARAKFDRLTGQTDRDREARSAAGRGAANRMAETIKQINI